MPSPTLYWYMPRKDFPIVLVTRCVLLNRRYESSVRLFFSRKNCLNVEVFEKEDFLFSIRDSIYCIVDLDVERTVAYVHTTAATREMERGGSSSQKYLQLRSVGIQTQVQRIYFTNVFLYAPKNELTNELLP